MTVNVGRFFVALEVVAIFLGCTEQKDDVRAADAAQERILQIKCELENGRSGINGDDGFREISILVKRMHDSRRRLEMAGKYAKMLLDFDPSRLPYRRWENATVYYFSHLECALRIMRESGCSTVQMVEFFFGGMTKFRNACLGVPVNARSEKESLEDFRCRRDCARKLRGEYAQRVSEIQRFWLPYLEDYFPTEAHEEFRRRISPFLTHD